MYKKESKNEKEDSETMQKLFKKNDISITKNTHNCLIYGNKNDFINEDIFLKKKKL